MFIWYSLGSTLILECCSFIRVSGHVQPFLFFPQDFVFNCLHFVPVGVLDVWEPECEATATCDDLYVSFGCQMLVVAALNALSSLLAQR